jgi:hypothetical protein
MLTFSGGSGMCGATRSTAALSLGRIELSGAQACGHVGLVGLEGAVTFNTIPALAGAPLRARTTNVVSPVDPEPSIAGVDLRIAGLRHIIQLLRTRRWLGTFGWAEVSPMAGVTRTKTTRQARLWTALTRCRRRQSKWRRLARTPP